MSIVVKPAAGGCDFDHRWSHESRPCSGWSVYEDGGSAGRFVLLTGSRVSADNVTRLRLPLVDHSEGTETGATVYVIVLLLWVGLNIFQSHCFAAHITASSIAAIAFLLSVD